MAQMIWHPKPTQLQIVKIGEFFPIYVENIHGTNDLASWANTTQIVKIRELFAVYGKNIYGSNDQASWANNTLDSENM